MITKYEDKIAQNNCRLEQLVTEKNSKQSIYDYYKQKLSCIIISDGLVDKTVLQSFESLLTYVRQNFEIPNATSFINPIRITLVELEILKNSLNEIDAKLSLEAERQKRLIQEESKISYQSDVHQNLKFSLENEYRKKLISLESHTKKNTLLIQDLQQVIEKLNDFEDKSNNFYLYFNKRKVLSLDYDSELGIYLEGLTSIKKLFKATEISRDYYNTYNTEIKDECILYNHPKTIIEAIINVLVEVQNIEASPDDSMMQSPVVMYGQSIQDELELLGDSEQLKQRDDS